MPARASPPAPDGVLVLGRIGRPAPRRWAAPAAPEEATGARTRVLVAEPHPLLRGGLRRLLGGTLDLAVVAEAVTGAEALGLSRTLQLDIALLGAGLADPDALEVLGRLRAERPDLRAVLVTDGPAPALALLALEAGAAGAADAEGPAGELMEAIRAVARGERAIPPGVAEALLERGRGGPVLSGREAQVLRLIARGHDTEGIARALAVGASTVRTYKGRLREKLGLRAEAALVRYAVEQGLV